MISQSTIIDSCDQPENLVTMSPMDEVERTFAQNLRRLREQRGWSQRRLAEEMAASGYGGRQATAHAVESGARGVRLAEAVALSVILDVHLFELTSREHPALQHLAASAEAVTRASLVLQDASREFYAALQQLRAFAQIALDEHPDD